MCTELPSKALASNIMRNSRGRPLQTPTNLLGPKSLTVLRGWTCECGSGRTTARRLSRNPSGINRLVSKGYLVKRRARSASRGGVRLFLPTISWMVSLHLDRADPAAPVPWIQAFKHPRVTLQTATDMICLVHVLASLKLWGLFQSLMRTSTRQERSDIATR